ELKETLATYAGELPDRVALEKAIEEGGKKQKPNVFPYAEKAPSGRSKCLVCQVTIPKGALRIAIERKVETGSFSTSAPGYLHPACVKDSETPKEGLLDSLKANSKGMG